LEKLNDWQRRCQMAYTTVQSNVWVVPIITQFLIFSIIHVLHLLVMNELLTLAKDFENQIANILQSF